MRACKQRRKALRAILNMQRKRAIKAHKLAKRNGFPGSAKIQMKKLDELLGKFRK